MLKRGLLTLLVLLLAACLCTGTLLGAGVIWVKNQSQGSVSQSAPLVAAATQPTAMSSPDISADIAKQMDLIQGQVSTLRGLTLQHTFNRATLTTDQLRQQVKENFLKNYTPQQAADDVLLYSTLGLLKPDTDIIKLFENLYSEQIAGFYDPETKTMYVVQGSGFNGIERMTYAHEFTHTLQDQHYDLRGQLKITDEYCHTHAEYCAAVTALVEGDAVSTEQDWFYSDGSNTDRSQVQDFYLHFASPVFDSSPDFIKDDLLFPYQKGFEFVQTLYDQGGWKAIDQAFENAPVSTAQILHPGLYPLHKPLTVTLPDLGATLGSGWRQAAQGSLGEWYTYLVLSRGWQNSMRLPEALGKQAAAGWGGDGYLLYQKTADPQARVLVVEWKWDSLADSDQFWSALSSLCKERWGTPAQESALELRWSAKNGETVSIQYTNQGTRWVVASNPAAFGQVRAAFK
jgi:hypothetical protein